MKKILPLLFLVLLLYTCTYKTKTSTSSDFSSINLNNTSKTTIRTKYKNNVVPICFEAAYTENTTISEFTDSLTNNYQFETYTLGKLKIESGEIIACDPSFLYDALSFSDKFPIGIFDIELALAKLNDKFSVVAYSRIKFSNQPVSQWIYATRKNEKKIPINDSTLYAFPVDAGEVIYIDKTARDVFAQFNFTEWEKVFIDKMYKQNYRYGFIHNFDSHNLAVFPSAFGDGRYGSFIGLDKEGKICRLLTDFGVIEWWRK